MTKMPKLRMPAGLTGSQKRRIDKYSKKATKGPMPSKKMPKGISKRKR